MEQARSPLYQQVKRTVIERIEAGEWSVGQPIPSEKDLCRMFHVSRQTVVRALSDLAREGLVDRRQGIGTFVSPPQVFHGPLDLQSFSEEMAERGLGARARVLLVAEEPPSPEVRRHLRLDRGERVVRVRRTRFAGTRLPMGIQEAHLPARLVPGLALRAERLEGSLYRMLREDYGIAPHRAVETVTATRFDKQEADLLGCAPGSLAFQVERVTYDLDNRAVEFVRSRMRGDRYRYVLELRRP